MKGSDISNLDTCQYALGLQLTMYLMTILLLANVFCNIKAMGLYHYGISQRTQYIFGIQK